MNYDNYKHTNLYMDIAHRVAMESTCIRRQVGAVLVKNDTIIATGFNGAPRGTVHCSEVGCIRKKLNIPSGEQLDLCRAAHAEQNAIISCAVNGVSLKYATLYCTTQPCVQCLKMLIDCYIDTIIFVEKYDDKMVRTILDTCAYFSAEYVFNESNFITNYKNVTVWKFNYS